MLKLSEIIPCRQTLALIMNMLSDGKFQVTINDNLSRLRTRNNGLPKGSALSCLLYSLYTRDLPLNTQSRLFIYADDIEVAFQSTSFTVVETTLVHDL